MGAYWDGREHHPFAGEGGHTDFRPRTLSEMELLRHLSAKFGRGSYERIVSGSGLHAIYEFLRERSNTAEPAWLTQQFADDPAPVVIVRNALDGRSELCLETVDQFVSIYAAEAGNLALKLMARGGVWIAGGPQLFGWRSSLRRTRRALPPSRESGGRAPRDRPGSASHPRLTS